ncbi:MAG: S4 domain-containing protein, partial [Sphingomicrobium sp.]
MTGPQRTTRDPVPRGSRSPLKGAASGAPKPRGPQKSGPKPGPARDDGPQRIAKLLARAGIASRREIERMIEDGRIAINGEKLTTPATVLESLAGVTVDGKPVAKPEAARLFLFYKPPSCLTAEFDPKGRPTIYDKLPKGLPR